VFGVLIRSARNANSAGDTATRTRVWVETMRSLESRTGMRELALRSLLHGAALGNNGAAAVAATLAAEIELSR